MTEMFGEAWSPMSVPDLAPDDDDDESRQITFDNINKALQDWKRHAKVNLIGLLFFFRFRHKKFRFNFVKQITCLFDYKVLQD